MQSVTIREAKARLNALVEAAERGEQVVLMRGSRHVAQIVPLSEEDLEVAPQLTDRQAERLWTEIATDLRHGAGMVMDSPQKAVAQLEGRRPDQRRPRHRSATAKATRRKR
jgi:prevent-host-death family protein